MLALDQQALERRSLDRNETLFRQGDKVTAIYFIETGRLRLERRTFDGRLLTLGATPAGQFFVPPRGLRFDRSVRGRSALAGGCPVVQAGRQMFLKSVTDLEVDFDDVRAAMLG